jgi:two-component system cell cycle sensor histidine kinase/response regulator CckA
MSTDRRKKNKARKVNISADMWEGFFRYFKVPLFVEDVSEVLDALEEIRQQGVTDFSVWLDAHPNFITRVISMINIVDASDFTVEWAGARDKKDLLASLGRMVLPETLPAFKSILVDLFNGCESNICESQYSTLDGRHIYTLNQALLPRLDERPALLVLSCTEITELVLTQKQLINSQERYSRLVEAAQDVILCHDLGGRITFISQACTDMTGWNKEQILGQDIGILLPENSPGGSRRKSLTYLGEVKGRTLYETELVTRDGRQIPVEVNATVIPGMEGRESEPVLLAMIRDISGRKEAERKQQDLENHLKNTQKMESLGVLAGGIAHDFNNLLVTIMGNTELLLGGKYSAREIKDSLGVIMEASTQAADLCRQMQAYAGKNVAQVAAADLNAIVDNMSRLLKVTVSGRAHISFQMNPGLPLVDADAGQIRQVLMNLVNNATESLGEDGGEIVVSTGHKVFSAGDLRQGQHVSLLQPGPYVFCEVRDSGSGMSADTVQKIFDPFFTTRGGNRGLGLSWALGTIQGHRGGFLVDSQPGKGTSVTFLLPLGNAVAVAKALPRSKKAPDDLHLNLTGKTVLSVDEDAAVRSVGDGFLRRLGCKVLSAGSGLDAVRIFSDRHDEIDAVLLDLTMEGMDGVETCRRLRVIRPHLPVVFSSGFSADEVHLRAAEVGSYRFVPKPFRLAQIRAIMAEALGSADEE